MTGHPSALELDEAAAGLAVPAVRAHLAACGACAARLEALGAQRQEVLANPRFAQVRARLPAPAARGRFSWWVPAAGLAAAAALVLAVRGAGEEGVRAKGAASIALVSPAGAATLRPRVGEEAELRLSGGSHRFVLALAQEGAGSPVVLYPAGGAASAELPAGGQAAVRLRVTPGAVRVRALFSDRSLSLAEALLARPSPGLEVLELEVVPQP